MPSSASERLVPAIVHVRETQDIRRAPRSNGALTVGVTLFGYAALVRIEPEFALAQISS